MIVSFHVTHYSVGADRIADVIPMLSKDADEFVSSQTQISEHVILRTCNRFEIYAETCDVEKTIDAFEQFADTIPCVEDKRPWFALTGVSSTAHLIRVICGLDSLVIGEDQIQGQIRSAYAEARNKGNASKILSRMFDRALNVGKRIRTETELNKGSVSVGSVAVELAENRLGDLSGKTVAVLGAGEMATTVARNLSGKGPNTIMISSRTFENARILADKLNGTAVRFSEVKNILKNADLFVVATSAPHILIDKRTVEEAMAGRNRRLLIIDISVPRNVSDDVSELHGVDIETMEGIGLRSSKNLMNRQYAISDAEAIIEKEIAELVNEEKERAADEAISEIAKKASSIRQEELATALSRAECGTDLEKVFDDFSKALVAKIMAEPYEKLREASRNGRAEICEIATDLFGVDVK